MQLLSLAAASETPLGLTASQGETFLRSLDDAVGLAVDGLRRFDPGRYEGVLALSGTPDAADVVNAVVDALAALGKRTGRIELSLSEHAAGDPELETPPWFQETVDLALREEMRSWATVSIDLYAAVDENRMNALGLPMPGQRGIPFTPESLAKLERALRARLTQPIAFFSALRAGFTQNSGARLELVPVPPTQAPSPEELEALVEQASAEAGVTLVRFCVGAYIGDWGNTVFSKVVEHESS